MNKRELNEMAETAAEFCKVSEQNRDVWMDGFRAGVESERAHAYRLVAKSCTQMAEICESSLKNAKTEE